MPKERGGWTTRDQSPEETARRFALQDRPCECREVSTALVSSEGDRAIVRVRLEDLRDDSLKAEEYLVVLMRVNGEWVVESATYMIECRRGVTDQGLCV